MSYNQKNSPKKLFAEASKKKNNYIQNHYQSALMNKNTNSYIACFTEENEIEMPEFGEKLEKNYKQIVVRQNLNSCFLSSFFLFKYNLNKINFFICK